MMLAAVSFFAGFVACLHLKSTAPASRDQRLLTKGNAPPEVRASVLQDLMRLQDGYTKRDPGQLHFLVDAAFPRDGDILILGTDGGEWIRDSVHAAQFIATDWRYWGDLRMDLDHPAIWSSGNVAWLATTGTVQFGNRLRPLRVTSILTREQDKWVFRQMHFQWDDKDAAKQDLLHPRTYLRLLNEAWTSVSKPWLKPIPSHSQ
jgi:hypothetical protein